MNRLTDSSGVVPVVPGDDPVSAMAAVTAAVDERAAARTAVEP